MESTSNSSDGRTERALTFGGASRSTVSLTLRQGVAASWDSLLAFLAPLFLYLATMAPTLYNLDSAEFTTAAYSGGLVRATG